jgi:5-formyltetrahydrofolate cyclo-ligase
MKVALRKQLRAARRSLSAADHRVRSALAAKRIAGLRAFRAGKRIALYLPFDRETNTADLIAAARRRHVRVFVPVVIDRRHGRLRFFPLDGPTRRGAFGIAVPRRTAHPVAAQWLNLIVVPVVGVDAEGRRLGQGGGFYDRALNFRRRRDHWTGPHLVGLAFDRQRTTSSFADTWDLRLDSLATETGLRQFPDSSPSESHNPLERS